MIQQFILRWAWVPVLALIVYGYVSILRHDRDNLRTQLAATQTELNEANEALKLNREIVERLDRLAESDRQLERRLSNAVQIIEASPNAGQLVPADIADAWYTGIISLRDEAGGSADSNSSSGGVAEMPNARPTFAERGDLLAPPAACHSGTHPERARHGEHRFSLVPAAHV